MNQRLVHRGPDGGDLFVEGSVALAHRRLAIIDPATGQQPLRNENGSIWLVANGEVYNFRELRRTLEADGHVFRTQGDCETIVHGYEKWGTDVVHHLRGMFAFALWDGRRRRLLLARDRVGIKPLCYALDANGIAFASELQALRIWPGLDRSIDADALDQFLHLQYIPAPGSIYRGIRKLEPGHHLVISADGKIEGPKRYWRMQWQADAHRTDEEWVEALDAALEDSVRAHLVSDVPFGAFLSGGVDSSTVVAYASKILDDPLRTFTIGFDTPEFDEREPARAFAQASQTQHQEQTVGLDALELLPRLVHHYGEPFADSSAVCTWRVCEAARRDVPMVLSGDGGDEVFAGYSYFPKLAETYRSPTGTPRRLRRAVGDLLRKAGLLAAAPDLADAWYGRSPWFGESERSLLYRDDLQGRTRAARDWNRATFASIPAGDALSRCQQMDIETYLPYDNLAKVDIASMAHGLEVRVPLLDHRLLEVVGRMPPSIRLRHAEQADGTSEWCGKYVLKKAANRFYPWEWLTTSKRGFSMPISRWLGGENKQAVRDQLCDPAAGLDEWFDRNRVAALIEEHGASQDHGHRLWSLLVLSEWKREEAA